MRKTTVYLEDEEAEGLRRLAAESGESQAELIREGVRRLLREGTERTFHSMGKGAGSGETRPRWGADAVREKTRGRR
ncbi:ribbon-helix-helix protein, CopG family [Rubrobacter tropicus]|uniref:Ribbon-helix-helix protein, CopG family n=1 Tax=Rubrobacter tropicus TaxID=2653851 RepID=A0A6G8Q5R7_9ACTN|nr:ribbon-helix-helix protein, CopG family [Rubrobacter tropicus]